MKEEELLYNEVKTVREFICVSGGVSAGGGYEAVVTVRTRCGWMTFRECGEFVYGKIFPLWLKMVVYESYVWPVILYAIVVWCMKE